MRKWRVEIGEDRCFHGGNRVSITESGTDHGEPWNVTIAELWPADRKADEKDARLIVRLVNNHFRKQKGRKP